MPPAGREHPLFTGFPASIMADGQPERISVQMSSMKHKPHGRETADETACTGRVSDGRAAIIRLARVAACCLCVLAAGGLLASASTGTASLRVAAATVAGPALAVKPVRTHKAAKATIGLFTATPARLPASGGKVRLVAAVLGAASCRLSTTTPLVQLPATKSCSSGNMSFSVELPHNHSPSPRTYRFHLTATAAGSSASAGPAWVVEGGAASSVDAAPAITAEPTGRSVTAGHTVSFTAGARGKPSPSVRWQVSGDGGRSWSNIAGATASTYSFRARSADSGDEYRAVFTNTVGSASTTVATLTVVVAPTTAVHIGPSVTTQPASESVVSTVQVTFTAAASGDPTPSVQWQLSGDGGTTWSDIAGARSASYSLIALTSNSGVEFRTVFTNAAGSATSNAATLTVSAPVAGPAITTQPGTVTIESGQEAIFTATASGAPAPSVQWEVSTDGGSNWSDAPGASTSTTYMVADVTSAAQYRAVFTNPAGSATTNAATLTISPPAAPLITLQPQDAAVTAGNTATFRATASGTPTPTVQWKVSSDGGSNWSDAPGASTSTTYSFTALASESGYEYEAVFTNGTAPDATTAPATLTVDTVPTVSVNPSDVTVATGATASFTATASGTPAPTVQWQVSTDGGSNWSDAPGASTWSTYSFPSALSQTGNEYRANLSNVAGSAPSSAATLTVTSAPTITAQPSTAAVVSGGNVSLTAGASGSPTPTVQWYVSMDGGGTWSPVAAATSTTYSFLAGASESGYEYEAEFSNAYGTATTNPATVVVGAYTAYTNWSGYAVTGATGSVSEATGSWRVPSVTCSSAATYAAQWVGIDGYQSNNNTVEQDGTDSDCSGGSPIYYAWYEMYGDDSPTVDGGVSIDLSNTTNPVSPGDFITATISVSNNIWTLTLVDNSAKASWTFATTVGFSGADDSSAGWVVERPELDLKLAPLADFGSTSFNDAGATVNGQAGSIGDLSGTPFEMGSKTGAALLALPSLLDPGGSGFTDTYYNSN
jgi:hypothetical protein